MGKSLEIKLSWVPSVTVGVTSQHIMVSVNDIVNQENMLPVSDSTFPMILFDGDKVSVKIWARTERISSLPATLDFVASLPIIAPPTNLMWRVI